METVRFFRLEKDNHILFWLGVRHSRDNSDLQFQEIKKTWENFIDLAKQPIVITEGYDEEVYQTEEEAVRKNGEVGFMAFLGTKNNIPVKCFEPNRHEEMNRLAHLFGKERTEYYYFGRAVAQWHRIIKTGTPEEYATRFLRRDERVSGWVGFEFSISHMRKIHRDIFGTALNFNDKDFFLLIENPTRKDNPIQEIVQESSSYRDREIVKNVKLIWKTKDILMMYGKDHMEAHKDGLSN